MTLFDSKGHRNVLLQAHGSENAVQCNLHFITDHRSGMVLDPGTVPDFHEMLGLAQSFSEDGQIEAIFLSHQDPDVVGDTGKWLECTKAVAYVSTAWLRFLPHLKLHGIDMNRVFPIPDEGMKLRLGSTELVILPAHFLHSAGNFHVYDPVSKILYSGDMGGSFFVNYQETSDFDSHVAQMEGFHTRYMASGRALRSWVQMVRKLDIETIAPQHGACMRGREIVGKFLDWCDRLECGIDVIGSKYLILE